MAAPKLEIKVVAFDLDGTLIDSADEIATAVNLMLGEYEIPFLPVDLIKTYIGRGVRHWLPRALAASTGKKPSETFFEAALEAFERHYEMVLGQMNVIYEEVVEGLETLKQEGFQLAVITNKDEKFTLPILKKAGLLGYFSLVVSGDTCARKKPDPMPLLHATKKFGIRPENLLMVGDSQNDTKAAMAAGSPVFVVPYGYTEGLNPYTEMQHDGVVETFCDIAKRITLVDKGLVTIG